MNEIAETGETSEIAARHGCHSLRGVATYGDVYNLTDLRAASEWKRLMGTHSLLKLYHLTAASSTPGHPEPEPRPPAERPCRVPLPAPLPSSDTSTPLRSTADTQPSSDWN